MTNPTGPAPDWTREDQAAADARHAGEQWPPGNAWTRPAPTRPPAEPRVLGDYCGACFDASCDGAHQFRQADQAEILGDRYGWAEAEATKPDRCRTTQLDQAEREAEI